MGHRQKTGQPMIIIMFSRLKLEKKRGVGCGLLPPPATAHEYQRV